MPDYIYLLQNRLSADQQNALRQIADAARELGMNVFLAGGAVRDLTSGSSVRDLDLAVQGNALKLKKPLEKKGAILWGEHEASRTLFFRFPVGVRVEVSSTRREEYPKPGKPVYHWEGILEDLRRRDFTVNAMALSLNERSYGLLMDPLNGVADIESRHLRLVSNYGFIEEPARLFRAVRLATRLGWELEERTKVRYENAKEEGVIEGLSTYQRGYELEEIGHEEDALRTLTALEAEGWMRHLDPAWTSAKADTQRLEEMHRLLTQLQLQGVSPDVSAVNMELLTAKLSSKEIADLKKMFVRPGFVDEWNNLDTAAKEFAKELTGKDAATPSATWKLFTAADPQAVLWLGLTSKAAPVQAKYKNFFTVWPEARQKIPHTLMQELRITPELPGYQEMLSRLFFETIDGKLETEAELRAFLEPYSPPAPPPPVTVRRTRASRKTGEPKVKLLVDSEAEIEPEDLELEEEAGEIEGEVEVEEEAGDSELIEVPSPKATTGAKKGKPEPKAEPSIKAEAEPVAAPPFAKKGEPKREEKGAAKPLSEKPAVPLSTKPVKSAAAAKPVKPAHGLKTVASAPAKKLVPAKGSSAKAASRPVAKTAGKPAAKKSAHAPKPQKKVVAMKKQAPAKKTKPAKRH
jgi:tRNA nucleotidyltransferase (CCA-adding enzyme)